MAITLIIPHQRPNSGGVYALHEFARRAALLTDINVVVAKGEPVSIEGVHMHGPDTLARLTLPEADALLIPADMRHAEHLFGLPPDRGAPMLFFQGYGTPEDPVVTTNLAMARRVVCTASWLVDEALRAGCTATLVRYGIDRERFSPGPPSANRGPVVGMMTHTLDWKGTADGLEALALVRGEVPELELRLFGKLDPGLKDVTFLAAPNEHHQIAALLRECAVFVCSSWEEGVGLPGIEAIASGAALATTDTKGSRDYALHGQTALVSQPHNPAALAKNIVQLIRDPALRERLIDAGREQIDATYADWDRATEAFVAAVHAAASEGGLTQAEQRIAQLESKRRTADQELEQIREALDDTRGRLLDAERAEANARRELAQLSAELELASAQRRRFQATLARARADAQLAEAERAAFERRTVELSAIIESDRDGRLASELANQPVAPDARTEAALALMQQLPSAARAWPQLPDTEREAQQTFLAEYSQIVAGATPCDDGRDPLSLPIPADVRRMLASGSEDQGAETASVDVIVCVKDALQDVRTCFWALLHKATRRFRLIAVNDGSDEATTAFLTRFAQEHPAVTLIHRTEAPHGYTIAANQGLRASTSAYVVLLNSDTIVSYHWLERIVEYGERHERVGILGPLSNAASHQSVPERRDAGEWATNPLPNWLTVDGVALLLERAAPRTETRLPFINGFCYVIRRAVIEAIGYFDEDSFPEGYAEENDYSQRARVAGFELGVVDDAYVYHSKSRSYGVTEGKQIARRGYETFLAKHGRDEINRIVAEMEADTTLDPVRAAIGDAISSPGATESVLTQDNDQRLSIAFVLPGIADGGSGGSHSIYQEVHGLRRLGLRATIALHESAWDRADAAYDDAEDLFERFGEANDLAELTADANVIIATHFKAVATVAAVRAQRDDFLPAYYVQDYEPMFKFADPADNVEAAASYTAIPDTLLFAKTHWLCNVVSRRHNVFVAKVEPSIDEGLYKSGASSVPGGPVRVVAMVRPRTPRRQPYSTIEVLEQLLDALPGAVEVTTFGCREAELDKITRSRRIHSSHLGMLKRDQVAELMRQSDLFLDMSTYQAFGRTALEAMACGCAAVVPRLGGAWEFADDGANLLAIDTFDREAAFEAIASLVDDRDRLAQLSAAARETASRYSILRAALSEYVVLRHAHESRFG